MKFKEIICFDVPQIVNLVETFNGDSFIVAAYKNKLEIMDQMTGDLLRLYQFNNMSTIRSIVELYDNKQLELLVTHNCKETL